MEEKIAVKKKKFPLIPIIVAAVVVVVGIITTIVVVNANSETSKINRLFKKANAYISDLEYKDAIACYKDIISIDPKNVTAYLGIADAYVALAEKTDDAEKKTSYYDKAISYLEKGYKETDDDDIADYLEKLLEEAKLYLNPVTTDSDDEILTENDTQAEQVTNDETVEAPAETTAEQEPLEVRPDYSQVLLPLEGLELLHGTWYEEEYYDPLSDGFVDLCETPYRNLQLQAYGDTANGGFNVFTSNENGYYLISSVDLSDDENYDYLCVAEASGNPITGMPAFEQIYISLGEDRLNCKLTGLDADGNALGDSENCVFVMGEYSKNNRPAKYNPDADITNVTINDTITYIKIDEYLGNQKYGVSIWSRIVLYASDVDNAQAGDVIVSQAGIKHTLYALPENKEREGRASLTINPEHGYLKKSGDYYYYYYYEDDWVTYESAITHAIFTFDEEASIGLGPENTYTGAEILASNGELGTSYMRGKATVENGYIKHYMYVWEG